ncbi:MAG TPA: maleylpyruvate isomerase family mycothiol-dependent enzyme [Candidatus Dormibacteraeota bacterium]|nr:maleylpyruvate isomerase family mycothiol-dependent enzyme [Candidatus Dormibacteraeota bacterium]
MESQPSRLAQARDWYVQALDAVPDDGWNGTTLCAGWTPLHVVAHVTTGDQLVRGLLLDVLGKSRAGEDLPIDFADRQRRFQGLLTGPPAEVKMLARNESEKTVAAVIDAVEQAPQTMVTMPVGPVPITGLRALRLNEYIIHGHDLGPAIGRAIPAPDWFIDRALADSIGLMPRLHQRSPHKGKSASFHIHRTDGDGEWTLRVSDGRATVEPGHDKGDVAMRGSAEVLYWMLMGRGRPTEPGIETFGDPALGAAFKEWFPGP